MIPNIIKRLGSLPLGEMKDEIIAWGHENITARHRTTLEVTKEENLTLRGDCIIGVKADKAIRDIDERIKEWLRAGNRIEIEIILPQYGLKDSLVGFGSRDMTFEHKTDIVVRKSDYVCERTLAIRANKAAKDIDREIVKLLKDPTTELRFVIRRA